MGQRSFLAENLRGRRVPSRPEGNAKLFPALLRSAGRKGDYSSCPPPSPRARPPGYIQDAAETPTLLKSPKRPRHRLRGALPGQTHPELAEVLSQETSVLFGLLKHMNNRPPSLAPHTPNSPPSSPHPARQPHLLPAHPTSRRNSRKVAASGKQTRATGQFREVQSSLHRVKGGEGG